MSERRLDPAALRARLAANLAGDPVRGVALPSSQLPPTTSPAPSGDPSANPAGSPPNPPSNPPEVRVAAVDSMPMAGVSSAIPAEVVPGVANVSAAAASEVSAGHRAVPPVGATVGVTAMAAMAQPTVDRAVSSTPPRARTVSDPTPKRAPSVASPLSRSAAAAMAGSVGAEPSVLAPRPARSSMSVPFLPSPATAPAVAHRHHEGAVLRGYRIPADLHRRAERAKVSASALRGATLHWDEVMQGAIDALPSDPTDVRDELERARNFISATSSWPGSGGGRAVASGATKVLQATLRHDQELRLRLLRLDLEELLVRTVRLEEIWTLLAHRVVESMTSLAA